MLMALRKKSSKRSTARQGGRFRGRTPPKKAGRVNLEGRLVGDHKVKERSRKRVGERERRAGWAVVLFSRKPRLRKTDRVVKTEKKSLRHGRPLLIPHWASKERLLKALAARFPVAIHHPKEEKQMKQS